MESLDRSKQGRWAAWVQMGLVLTAIEGALWSQGRTQAYWFIAAFVVLIACVLWSRPRVDDLGLGLRGVLGASVAIPLAVIVSTATLLLAWLAGTLRPLTGALPVAWHAFFYAVWALEQQFILNSFFYRRLEFLMGRTSGAVIATAVLFSLVHLPNPVLVPATFLGGLFFVPIFRRFGNIYPLAVAHAILGLTLAVSFPDTLIRHMHVGMAFVRFQGHG